MVYRKGIKALKEEKAELAFKRYQERKNRIIVNNETISGVEWRKVIRPILKTVLKIVRKAAGQTIEVISTEHPVTDRPIIYAVSHIGKFDFERVNEIIPNHFWVAAADYKSMYGNINGIFMYATGVVWINEKSKQDRTNSKQIMTSILRQGDNILIFPEGAWNLSENEIIRDTSFGAVHCALEANAVIIPIAIEQYNKRFVINVGDIFDPMTIARKYIKIKYSALSENKKEEKGTNAQIRTEANRILRDTMATLKYEIWEREGLTKRIDIPKNFWECFIQERVNEWPAYDMEGQIDNGCFPKEKKEWIRVQQVMAKLNPKWWSCCWITKEI